MHIVKLNLMKGLKTFQTLIVLYTYFSDIYLMRIDIKRQTISIIHYLDFEIIS